MVFAAPIQNMTLEPGSIATFQDVSWLDFEAMLQDLGEDRGSRISYFHRTLEIMVPLPDHERSIVLTSDIVKLLLRLQKRPWESLRSTTFKKALMAAGVEPDDCFYIANYKAVIGKDRIDLNVDPPPDLAIESDYTSRTRKSAYAALGVKELWIYTKGQLRLWTLQDGIYIEQDESPTFPGLDLRNIVVQTLQEANRIGTSAALLNLEQALTPPA